MSHSINLLDGAMGTLLWERSGEQSPVWQFNITRPELVMQLHRDYIDSGSQIILSNTFAANGPAVSRSKFTVEQVIGSAVKLAKEAAGTQAQVALDVGPLTAMLEPYGDMTEEEAEAIYEEIMDAGMKGKPDLIFLETFFDLNILEIAVKTAKRYDVPVFASMAFEAVGKTMMGNSVEDMVEVLSYYDVAGLGLNCNLTPEAALPVLRRFRDCTELPLIFKPNAGKPVLDDSGKAHSGMGAEKFVNDALPALTLATYVGGCCGTSPDFIAALHKVL